MKNLFSTFFFLVTFFSFSQFQVNVINVTSNDLVYDQITDKIYISIPSSNGSNGNSIGVINIDNYTLENTYFIGSEPTVLAISDNGQYIYSGFSGTSTVRRFNVTNLTPEIQFSLGSDSSTGSFYVEDIEVMPSNPNTIAVSRRNIGYSPKHEGVAIYDNGIMRTTTTPDHTGSNRIEFTSSNSLIGYNNETTEFGIRRLAVNAGGVTNVSVTQSVLNGFYLDFYYHDNKMYATNGKVVDITSAPFVSGQFTNATGPCVYDTSTNLVCYGSFDSSGNITFKRFNPNTFLISDNLQISQAFGTVKNIITCGNGCYAFNTSDNKVIIIKDLAVLSETSPSNFTEKNSIFPNPFNDHFNFKSIYNINKIEVFDPIGRSVFNYINYNSGSDLQISLNNFNSGIYILKTIDENGTITTNKIIKK